MANSIGDFEFKTLRGEVSPPVEQIDRPQVRPGVDGVGLWKTGVRGVPFRLRSMVDKADRDTARDELKKYRDDLIGADPVPLLKNDYDYDGKEAFKVAVLEVREQQVQDVHTVVGGENVGEGQSGTKLVCIFTLIAVANPV